MDKTIYMSVDEVAELVGNACLECRKLLYLLLTDRVKGPAPKPEEGFDTRSSPTLHSVLEDECEREGLPFELARMPNNGAKVVHVRRAFARRARDLGYSYPQIGRFLGCHHTTVINLVRQDGIMEKRACNGAAKRV